MRTQRVHDVSRGERRLPLTCLRQRFHSSRAVPLMASMCAETTALPSSVIAEASHVEAFEASRVASACAITRLVVPTHKHKAHSRLQRCWHCSPQRLRSQKSSSYLSCSHCLASLEPCHRHAQVRSRRLDSSCPEAQAHSGKLTQNTSGLACTFRGWHNFSHPPQHTRHP